MLAAIIILTLVIEASSWRLTLSGLGSFHSSGTISRLSSSRPQRLPFVAIPNGKGFEYTDMSLPISPGVKELSKEKPSEREHIERLERELMREMSRHHAAAAAEDENRSKLKGRFRTVDSHADPVSSSSNKKPISSEAIGSKYRFRKPPTVNTTEPTRLENTPTIVRKLSKNARNNKAKFEQDQHGYFPFSFPSSNFEHSAHPAEQSIEAASFQDLGIKDLTILDNLLAMKLSAPMPSQIAAIPVFLRGESMVLQAQTGSGKTLAFLLPLYSLIQAEKDYVQAIVLAPGRELATQIGRVAEAIFKNTAIRCQTIIGGANAQHQLRMLKERRPQIIVATPGRLAEIIFRYEKLNLRNVRAVVLDEADGLLKAPFADEVRTLMDETSFGSQIRQQPSTVGNLTRVLCLSSATAKHCEEVAAFMKVYCPEGRVVRPLASSATLPTELTHALYTCPRIQMFESLRNLLHSQPSIQRALVFVNDPHRVQVVCDALLEKKIIAAPLHGESSKDDRKEVMARVRDGRVRIVVTTELAARGLDIPEVSHVINLDLPTDPVHYVHRAGRCGRAGKPGLVISLATATTKFVMRRFAKQLGVKVHDLQLRSGQVYLKRP